MCLFRHSLIHASEHSRSIDLLMCSSSFISCLFHLIMKAVRAPTHCLIQSANHLFSCVLPFFLSHLFLHSSIRSLVHLFIHLFVRSLVHISFICSFIHAFVCSFVPSFIVSGIQFHCFRALVAWKKKCCPKPKEFWMPVCLIHKLTMGFAVVGVINGVLMQETFKASRTGLIFLGLIMILCWMIFNAAPHMWLHQPLYIYIGIMKKIGHLWWSNNAKIDLDGNFDWVFNRGLASKFRWSGGCSSYLTSWMVRVSSFCRPWSYSITPQGPFRCMFQLQHTIRGAIRDDIFSHEMRSAFRTPESSKSRSQTSSNFWDFSRRRPYLSFCVLF